MHVQYKQTNFDINEVVDNELPFMSAFYRSQGDLTADATDLLSFPLKNKSRMPFYTVPECATYDIGTYFERYYAMMVDALGIAFNDSYLLKTFFNCGFMRKHGQRFVPYAKYTFEQRHPALYGRFDAVLNPRTNNVEGVYEFNGDTPVMLFESVNLQNMYSAQLGTEQYNNWWNAAVQAAALKNYKNVAVACGLDYVEDMATCETVAQMFQASRADRNVFFLDLDDLDLDYANLSKPFVAKDSHRYLDAVYILSPWEEMIENFPSMLSGWERWVDNVHIFEPAWRWFFSHKGIHALCWELMRTDPEFADRHAGVPIIPTYMSADPFYGMLKCVQKPCVGRLSNNIRVINRWGGVDLDTGGFYPDDACVFQEYREPYQMDGKNFVACMWMAPTAARQYHMDAATLCFREFDSEVLSISNERFVPHIIEEEHEV